MDRGFFQSKTRDSEQSAVPETSGGRRLEKKEADNSGKLDEREA